MLQPYGWTFLFVRVSKCGGAAAAGSDLFFTSVRKCAGAAAVGSDNLLAEVRKFVESVFVTSDNLFVRDRTWAGAAAAESVFVFWSGLRNAYTPSPCSFGKVQGGIKALFPCSSENNVLW